MLIVSTILVASSFGVGVLGRGLALDLLSVEPLPCMKILVTFLLPYKQSKYRYVKKKTKKNKKVKSILQRRKYNLGEVKHPIKITMKETKASKHRKQGNIF